ncbi:hypothetical protein [Alteromonas sp. a30]|uniref:hypothetical protein n=1 Tax=Alteromonas sp. a30 TaxID=2730917 RepID=UPI002282B11D|nr:hypothetical protein [Alteromonas sp. a30]MCY7294875.1 hypothetical protein [Alteromonas sp. a30]
MLSTDEKDKVIEEISLWSKLPELSKFAVKRHGYGNSDGGFGVTYEHDLDDYDREVEGNYIPKGCLEVYGFWGKPDGYEFHISEKDYLLVLAEVLKKEGFEPEAKEVLNKVTEIT